MTVVILRVYFYHHHPMHVHHTAPPSLGLSISPIYQPIKVDSKALSHMFTLTTNTNQKSVSNTRYAPHTKVNYPIHPSLSP